MHLEKNNIYYQLGKVLKNKIFSQKEYLFIYIDVPHRDKYYYR